jgi:hypothetical protein
VEAQARQAGLNAAGRQDLRQRQSVPLMAALKTRLAEIRQQIPPVGKLAQACDYALGQWSRREVFLQNGRVEIDNNWCHAADGITPSCAHAEIYHNNHKTAA